MRELVRTREGIKEIYGKYAAFIDPIVKFVLAMVTYALINSSIGNMELLKNPLIMILAALLNAILPTNSIIVFACAFSVLHMYADSIFSAAVVLIAFMLMYLLYFRFSPQDSIIVLLTPISFALHIPYAVPLCAGIGGGVFSCVSVAAGVFSWYVVKYCASVKLEISQADVEATASSLRSFIGGLVVNKNMLLVLAAFALTTVLVSIVKRLSINYCREAAIIGGASFNMLFILTGNAILRLNVSILNLLVGTIIAIPIALVLNFFLFAVDYAKTENLQFEDDEYYYYVKAVPKITARYDEDKVDKSTADR